MAHQFTTQKSFTKLAASSAVLVVVGLGLAHPAGAATTNPKATTSTPSQVTPVPEISTPITPIDPSAPAPSDPTSVTAVAGDGQVTVSWDQYAADQQANISEIDVTDSTGTYSCTVTDPSATSCTIVGLPDGSPMTFTVTAVGIGGSSDAVSSNAVTPTVTSGAVAPDAPSSITVDPGDTWATITLDAPSNDGGSPVSSYTVTATDDQGTEVGTCTVTPDAAGDPLSCEIDGLTPGATYTYTATATNGAGTSAAITSDPVAQEILGKVTPTNLTPTSVTRTDSGYLVTFTDPSTPLGFGYYLVTADGGLRCATSFSSGTDGTFSCVLDTTSAPSNIVISTVIEPVLVPVDFAGGSGPIEYSTAGQVPPRFDAADGQATDASGVVTPLSFERSASVGDLGSNSGSVVRKHAGSIAESASGTRHLVAIVHPATSSTGGVLLSVGGGAAIVVGLGFGLRSMRLARRP